MKGGLVQVAGRLQPGTYRFEAGRSSVYLPGTANFPKNTEVDMTLTFVNEQTGALEDILPRDNCLGQFVGITIYNRWGRPVYESTSRDFRWYPDDGSSGVYFYTLTFSDKEYKGSVTVRN